MPVKRKKGRSRMHNQIIIGGTKGILAWGMLVKNAARRGEDVPVDTGHLARNIDASEPKVELPAKFSIRVGVKAGVPYAAAHEFGSGLFAEFGPKKKIEIWAGALRPGQSNSLTPKKALSFAWEGGPKPHPALQTEGPYAGKYVFGKVEHPGVPARKYMRKALANTKERGKEIFLAAIKAEMGKK